MINRYINKVTVQDLQTRQVWQFLCDCWLSADRGDGMTKKTFNAAKNNEIASFRSECEQFYRQLISSWICVSKLSCLCLSGIFSRAEHLLASGTNTSGCPSWILPPAVRSLGPRGSRAAWACSSAQWPSILPSGTFLSMRSRLYSFHWVIFVSNDSFLTIENTVFEVILK